ncbi:MAG TPA: OpgC domain-containing protein [Kofleriaceae bacterium]|nr:OpgC domain-containing protein [Kofleriaceae bacterium]
MMVDRGPVTPRRTRDLALDLLRGYFLVIIIIDHLRYATNPLYVLSGRKSLWVTAAEGFVLISGFLVGMLRGDQARREGLAAASRHLLRRAAVLALWCALLTVAFRAISEATGYWPQVPNADVHGSFTGDVLGALVLRFTYGDHNLLAAYALYLAASPLVLAALLRGYTWSVLAASLFVWGLAIRFHLTWSNSVQADLCWQLLFMTGVVAGFHHAALTRRWHALTPRARKTVHALAAAAAVAIIAGSLVRLPVGGVYPTRLEGYVFEHDLLGPGRFACAVVLIGSLYALVGAFEARLVPTIGKVLVPLGQASLYVYIVQSMATFVLVDTTMASPYLAAAITLALVGGVWLLVTRRVLFGIIPR